jgi:hypothetical protein
MGNTPSEVLDLSNTPEAKMPTGIKPMLATLVAQPFDRRGWRALIAGFPDLLFSEHIEECGIAFFQVVAAANLEGIVARTRVGLRRLAINRASLICFRGALTFLGQSRFPYERTGMTEIGHWPLGISLMPNA